MKLAVLISGNGRTLQNLIDHISDGRLDATICCVVSSKPDAYGLVRARNADIPTFVERNSARIFTICHEADLVCLAGFLPLLEIGTERVINIHPSLLPAFGGRGYYGLHVHRAVLEAGMKVSGCTVHFADNEYDHGEIILQRIVPVEENDTPESLQERVFAAECEALPAAIELLRGNDGTS